ncbi:5-(carboxyamino)imidazole ribonucleotide mutase [Escherichia coli]
MSSRNNPARVAIVMGSKSDWATMQFAAEIFEILNVPHHVEVVSAHRTPDKLFSFAESAEENGYQVIIAGAGGAAHLPGMIAAKTLVPVLGVPVQSAALSGVDSLYSIVQMPRGIPVGTLAMDAGAMIRAGSIVTAMTRNGNMFGIRVSGLGERWFTAPVNTPQGLFFTGFSQEQANPDMGDSAITETFGIGGAAMIAAPGVTRFVGAGGMEAARAVSEEMAEIYLERNMQLQIPGWDFQGACLGLDIRRVVETGITPLINTGIAHKEAGIGQIGAGTVRAPLACFEQALEALAESMGIG